MELINTLLIPLLSVVIVIVVVACVVIYNRKRRQQTQPAVAEGAQPTAVEETQSTIVEEAQPTAAEEPQPMVVEEAEPTAAEETQPTPVEEAQAGAAPETQPIVVQEAQPTAVAETQPAAVEEAQPIAAEELQPTVAEETQPTVVEEAQPTAPEETEPTVAEEARPQVAQKVQPTCAEEVPLKTEGGRRKPKERGGRPRSPAQGHEEGPTQEAKTRGPKPEIICWKRERQWIPAVEVPEELFESPDLAVFQNGLSLTQDESREGCWRLQEACGQVVVQWNEDEVARKIKVVLGEESYLLFKLSGQDQNQGRLVKSPSSGPYLVMVPDNWERDNTLSGPPPVAPEPVSLAGYQAHFFVLEKDGDEKIAFRTPADESVVIEPKASRFELIGTRLNDASEYVGPLFGEMPPRILALGVQAWKNVRAIVVGEEGSSQGKWRTAFSPDPGRMEQDLPSELAARKGGWYFLRFYDANDDLIESLDFRFICALREIRIPQSSPLPSEDGHGLVRVVFLHEPGCAVQPADGLRNIQIERRDDKTILTISPDPTYDETRWLVGPKGGPQVEVTILVERLWWAVGQEGYPPSEWRDKILALARDDFAATSKKALWLRLPRRRWVDRVLVGFEQPKARSYDVRVTEKTIAVPFREYGDFKEVGDRTQEHPFKVWIKRDGGFMEGVVAVIQTSQVVSPPTPYWVGFGRKKTAVAKAVLQNGSGEIKINGQAIDRYFRGAPLKAKYFLRRLLELDQAHEALSQMEVLIIVTGSSPTTARQAKAAAHALARALMSYDSKLKPLLKQAGFGGVRVTKVPTMEREG